MARSGLNALSWLQIVAGLPRNSRHRELLSCRASLRFAREVEFVMRRSVRAFAIAALAGTVLAGLLVSPAFAAKSGSQRYAQSHQVKSTSALRASRIYRCKGGRYYTYGGGWGCDYYRYSYDWPFGRRR